MCQQLQDSPGNDNIIVSSREQIEILDTLPLSAIDAEWNDIFSSAHLLLHLLPSNGRIATGFARVSLVVYHLLSRYRTGQTWSQIEF